MAQIHTVLGAGQVGEQLAVLLARRGHEVRLVRRSAGGEASRGVTWMRGDITDRAFADAACDGAHVVYNCTNPSHYHRWDGVYQPLVSATWQAAGRARAKFVHLDNLYMYGMADQPFDEQTPMRPCSHKGELRKAVVEELFEAHRRGDVRVTSGRASDYFGPCTINGAVFRPEVYQRIVMGGSAWLFCNPDTVHSYSYTPDVARGLATLGERDAALGEAWHLPVAATCTTRELFARFSERASTSVRVRRVPRWFLRAIGAVSPLVAALLAMDHQWEGRFEVDDSRFVEAFGHGATPLGEAIDITLKAHGMVSASKAATSPVLS